MATKKAKFSKVHCSECRKVTNHDVLASKDFSGEVEEAGIQWWETYEIIQCRGCDEVSFRRTSANTEDVDFYTGKLEETERLYPNPTETRQPMEGYDELPAKTRRVYREVLKALSHGTPILAAIGLRAVIESVCLDQNTKSRSLAKGIDELAELGHLSKTQATFLHKHRFMGNVAAHAIVAPKAEHLIAALDIAETLLRTIYVLPTLAKSLDKK